MSNIDKYSHIRGENLDEEFYFQSFLQEAYNQEALTTDQLERIKIDSVKLLAENSERCSKGKSSSIKMEAAQAIMASDFYTIGLYLKSLPLSSALEAVKNIEVSELYWKGRKVINNKIKTARYLYHMVCKTRTETLNHSYNATIEEGIKSFFKAYDAEFEAHEIPAAIDYQLMNSVNGFAGVEYINQYLYSLYLENLLCSRFKSTAIHKVMCEYHSGYKDLLVNLSEQVLQNAIACVILKKDILSLNLSVEDTNKLADFFRNEEKQSIEILLRGSVRALLKHLAISSQPLLTYIFKRLPDLAARVVFASENGTLQTVFVINKRDGL